MRATPSLLLSLASLLFGLVACVPEVPLRDQYVPRPVPSIMPAGLGWRTVATHPIEPNAHNGTYTIENQPAEDASWMGDYDGRLHARVTTNLSRSYIHEWISFSMTGDSAVTIHVGDYIEPEAFVLDSDMHYYHWAGIPYRLERTTLGEVLETEPVFEFVGVRPASVPGTRSVSYANRNLDILVVGEDGPNADRTMGAPMMFVQPNGAAMGTNYAIARIELQYPREVERYYYAGSGIVGLNPVGGRPYAFQVSTHRHASSLAPRALLNVFGTTDEVSQIDPSFRVLRRLDTLPVDVGSEIFVLETPTRVWILVQSVENLQLVRFDRETETLIEEWTIPWPAEVSSGDELHRAITDDGALYLGRTDREFRVRILRVLDGEVTDLWPSEVETMIGGLRGLYSTGARVYALVIDSILFTYSAYGPSPETSLLRPRFSFLTPDVPDVPTPPALVPPPAFEPPPDCNPVTNERCGAGESCDVGPSRNGFACAPAGTGVDCAACNPNAGPFCAPGYTCLAEGATDEGICVRHCCTTADCGVVGVARCVVSDISGVGLCAGARVDIFTPACSGIPAVPPSGGTCGNP